jgi:CBS domain-containing protein
MATARDILTQKGKIVYTLSPNQTILEALKLMAEKGSAQ